MDRPRIDPFASVPTSTSTGCRPFSELGLVNEPFASGADVRLGDIRVIVVLDIRRCAATALNPATARRDLPLPRLLLERCGHTVMGVYVSPISRGLLRPRETASRRDRLG